MLSNTRTFITKFLLCLILLFCVATSQAAGLQSNATAWLSVLPSAPADAPYVERVQSIFRNIKRAARGANIRARLFVVDSDNEPWAVALQDGNIILSRGAIDVAYDGADLAISDARIAFVLGHELAHIIANDFWHQQVYLAFSASGTDVQSDASQAQRRKEQELRADEEGLLYASLAGYNTRSLLDDSTGKPDFLHHWANQTGSIAGDSYHTPKQRRSFLRKRLATLDEAVAFYKYGVKLAHFGRYQDAQLLLDEFYRAYPSKQVLSNLGFVYIQLARKKMPANLAYRYWYPTLLDYDEGLPQKTRSLDTSLPEAARHSLLMASDLLEAAINLDNSDIVARINLIAVQLYLGKIHAANANVIEAMIGRETDPQLLALRALVKTESAETSHWNEEAKNVLLELASQPNADENIVYNFARLLTERGRKGMATKFWATLANKGNTLPRSYYQMVCNEIAEHDACVTPATNAKAPNLIYDTDIQHGDDVALPSVRAQLKHWNKPLKRRIGSLDVQIFEHPNGNSALALNGVIEFISIKQHQYRFANLLEQALGEPWVNLPMGKDSVWSYGDRLSALIRDGEVEELWLAQ